MAKGKYEHWLTPDGLTQLKAWARDGLTDEEIATKCGICRDTLYEWKKRFPDISDALKKGKDAADIEVENALFKRATGYTVVETRVEYEFGVEIKRVEITKEVPGDVGAQCFWLKNRRPDKWRDKQQVEASVDSDIQITFADELQEFVQ
ncbi:MAG: helix-turn-helix domain-containing protein [Ruminococcaceae bacterium]|nr:helix-turn-helix domain-containing protein [Oscillospiraceae bacterium]